MLKQVLKKGRKMQRPKILYVLCTALMKYDDKIYLYDKRNLSAAEIYTTFFGDVTYLARIRKAKSIYDFFCPLDINQFRMASLPDYGISGPRGLLAILRLIFSPAVNKRIRDLVQECSLVYVEAPSIEGWVVARWCKKLGKKIVLEMNTESTLICRYMWMRFGLAGLVLVPLFKSMFAFVRSQAVAGVFVNKSLVERYPLFGNLKAAISDVNIDDDWFSTESRIFNKPASRFLFVGNLEKVKQVNLLISALALVKDDLPAGWNLKIVGEGPERPVLEKLAASLGIGQNVKFIGHLPHNGLLRNTYNESDMLLVASISETGPRVVIEAMAMGLPVFSTRVGIVPEVIDGQCLVSRKISAEGYGQALLKLALDPVRLTQISNNNRNKAEAFRLSIIYELRKDIYSRALKISMAECPGK